MIQKKRLSLTIFSGVLVELLNKVAPLLILHFALQRLGLQSFGFAMYGISIVELFLPFIVFGYNHLGALRLTEWRENPKKVGELAADLISLRLLHAGVLLITLGLVTGVFTPYRPYRPLLFSLSFAFLLSAFEFLWVHLAIQRMFRINIFVAVARFTSLGLILMCVQKPQDAILFAVLMLVSNALINIFSAIDAFSLFPWRRPSWQRMCGLWQQALPLACILALTTLLDRCDIVLVERLVGVEGAGLYAGPARLGHSLFQVANALVLAFFSEMLALKEPKALREHLHLGVWALTTLLSPIVFGVWFVGAQVLVLIFGEPYRGMAKILGLTVMGTSLSLAIAAFGLQILVVRGQLRFFVLALLLGAITAVSLGLGLYSLAGIYGIAGGILLGKLLALLLILAKTRSLLGSLPLAACLKALVPAGVMACVLHSVLAVKPLSFFTTVALGGSIFCLVLLLLNKPKVVRLYQQLRRRSHG